MMVYAITAQRRYPSPYVFREMGPNPPVTIGMELHLAIFPTLEEAETAISAARQQYNIGNDIYLAVQGYPVGEFFPQNLAALHLLRLAVSTDQEASRSKFVEVGV